VVLAGHWLALAGLPLDAGGGAQGRSAPLAFHTRLVQAPPTPAAAPGPAPPPRAAPPKPRPAHAPRPQPVPPPPAPEPAREAPQPAPGDDEAPQQPPALAALASAAGPADGSPADAAPAAAPPAQEDQMPQESPAPPAGDAAPAAVPPSPGEPPAPAPAAPTAPAQGTGVEIRPPGAQGTPGDQTIPPVRLPASTRLSFQVQGQAKRLQYRASAELAWRQDGARYEARQQIKAFLLGARSQSSAGRITAHGLQPERFGDKSRSERAAHFDFERGEVTFSANAPSAALHEGAQDRLSVFIQLGAMLAAAPERYPSGTQITLTTVGVRSADRWTFTVEGPETLDLPAGPTPALKLQRVPRQDRDYDQKAELWLGTQLGYLPVRIRITQANGDYADLLLDGHDDAP